MKPLGQHRSEDQLNNLARGLVIAALAFLFLYIGQPFLKPLVIASLLSFILAPIIRLLRRWGVWRAPAVLATVGTALLLLAIAGSIIVYQITDLAAELPKYEATLQDKARQLSNNRLTSNALEKASAKLEELGDQIAKQRDATPPTVTKPLLVEVLTPEPKGFQSILTLITPLISPLTALGLIILFLLFICLEREDLRDRFIRLAGTSDLHRTTVALDDAGERLSGYFLMQIAINCGFGIVIAIGLTAIGIPHAALWGIMSGMLRYVPFIGTVVAAFFPTLLAAAVDPGWHSVWLTVALFAGSELIARQVLEPKLYGPHTGLSSVAVVVSTLLWTLLWGPLGLLLATPLTVCLVVFGRHIEAFNFIEVLLGDEPALEPEQRFYQRLLAGDAAEASDVAEEGRRDASIAAFYDSVPMKALMLAQSDVAQGKLSAEAQDEILETVEVVVDDLEDLDDSQRKSAVEDEEAVHDPTPLLPFVDRETLPDDWKVGRQVICTEGKGPIDYSAAILLAQILRKHGLDAIGYRQARATGNIRQEDAGKARIVCISHFETGVSLAQIRFVVRRMRRQMPNALFVACLWSNDGDAKLESKLAAVGADKTAKSLASAARICLEFAGGKLKEGESSGNR